MALDEALLELRNEPVLRFYRWNAPSISFGYFASCREARKAFPGRLPVRRWTGGGIVEHCGGLTYSLIFPGAKIRSAELYHRVHAGIAIAVNSVCGFNAKIVTGCADARGDLCFSNPVVGDLISGGRKIAGAAQRRTRSGILQQGEIQIFSSQLPAAIAAALADEIGCAALTAPEIELGGQLDEQKYSTRQWIERC